MKIFLDSLMQNTVIYCSFQYKAKLVIESFPFHFNPSKPSDSVVTLPVKDVQYFWTGNYDRSMYDPQCNEKPIYVFPKKELRGISPNSTFMCLWVIYIFPGSVHIFSCVRIARPIVGIYKSLTDPWMWKLGLRPLNSFSGNILFEFSVLCLCSAGLMGPVLVGGKAGLEMTLIKIKGRVISLLGLE